MSDLLIGIDAGTSVIKSVAFDMTGRQIAAAMIPNRYATIKGGGAEQDPARTWTDTAATLRALGEKVPDLARRTQVVAVTGQGDGTWLVDRAGDPVGQAWLWLDARAADFVERKRAEPEDARRFEITGTGLAACQQGPQLARMRELAPEMLAQAATAFHCKDWLYLKLTGARATDPSEAMFSFGDFRAGAYSAEVIEILGLTGLRRLLPPIVDARSEQGALTADAAWATGLAQGTPVVLAAVDIVCTALGAGLLDPTASPGCTVLGSTGMHMRLAPTAEDVTLNVDRTGYTIAMPVPDAYAQIQSNMAATLNIDWVLGLASGILATEGLARTPEEMFGRIETWMDASAPGAILYQPFVSEAGERGPFLDARARAGFVGLSTRHGYGDLVRAVFEGLAFAARDCYEAMGPVPAEVRLSGGAARSPALRRILSAVLGADLRCSARAEAGAAGAAMISAVSIGQYDTMEDCARDWVAPLLGEAESPDPELAQIYDRVYPAYAAAHQALRPVWRAMAEGAAA